MTTEILHGLDAKLARGARVWRFDIVAAIGAALGAITMLLAASKMSIAEIRSFLPF